MESRWTADFGSGFVQINPANEYDIAFRFTFDKDNPIPVTQLKNNKLRLVKNDAKLLNDYKRKGLIFQGIPAKLELIDKDGIDTVELFLDPRDAKFSGNDCEITVKQRNSLEWFNDSLIFSFEYLFLNKIKNKQGNVILDTSKFVFVPSVNSLSPEEFAAMMSILTGAQLYMASKQIQTAIEGDIEFLIADPMAYGMILKLIADVFVSVVLIAMIIKTLLAFFQYLVGITKYQCTMFVRDLLISGADFLGLKCSSTIFLDKYDKDGNLNPFYNTTILDLHFDPPMNSDGSNFFKTSVKFIAGIKGYTQPTPYDFNKKAPKGGGMGYGQKGYPESTFDDFLRKIKVFCNGKVVITTDEDGQGTLHLETWNWQPPTNKTFKVEDIRNDNWGYNTDEFHPVAYIKFETDVAGDKNTINNWLGNNYEITQVPLNEPENPDMRLTGGGNGIGLQTYQIEWCRATRKNELTIPEKIYDDLTIILSPIILSVVGLIDSAKLIIVGILKTVISIAKALKIVGIKIDISKLEKKKNELTDDISNSIDKAINPLQNRIGMLLLEGNTVTSSKIFILEPNGDGYGIENARYNKIWFLNDIFISAKNIYNKFYKINNFVETIKGDGNHNQYLLPDELKKVPIRKDCYKILRQSNKAEAILRTEGSRHTSQGDKVDAKLDYVDWWYKHGYADIKYRIKQLYTVDENGNNQLKLITSEPDGQ